MLSTRNGVVRFLSICLAAGLFAFISAPKAHADAWNQRILITVNGPVDIPGRVLAPGTYTFQLFNPGSGNAIVGITDLTTGKFVTFLFTTPTYRRIRANRPIVELEERPAYAPPAIHKWFYPGFHRGMEFNYPRSEQEERMGALMQKNRMAKG